MEAKSYSESDNYFSAWIFVLFLMYYSNISYFNPIILLVFAFITVVIATVYIYLETRDVYHLFSFAYVNIFIILIPIFLIINRPVYYYDWIISVVVTFLYYVYITYYRKFNVFEFYQQMPSNYLRKFIETFMTK